MEFGVFDHLDLGGRPHERFYRERLEIVEAYERAGFYSYHVAEHHLTPLGMAPSPSVFLAAVAQRTKRLRFGPMVYVAPLYHRLRLLEEICMLDQMSGGRLELAFGRGALGAEVRFFDVDPAQSEKAFQEIVGFVLLDRANHTVSLNWEAFDLLRATGRQAASYLAEERSTRALRDTELLTEYSKRFAFVVHDIKNLASQLSLIVSNAKHYIDDPEFQRDMLRTVEDSVARMNNLLGQLKADAAPRAPRVLNPNVVIDAVATEFAASPVTVAIRTRAIPGSP